MANLRPLHDRVLIKVLPPNTKTSSGIIIPETAAEKPQEGEVVAVGTGRLTQEGRLIPLDIAPGDKILFSKYSGVKTKSDDEDLLLIREGDILAIIEEK